ncbi:MAG: permease [Proteobacteria bacterium]|nr:MAG: permease [Pseudomonadota bacterium]
MSDLSPLPLTLLVFAGLAAGFINTLAGGGSLLALPALALLGLPWEVANGTNRVAVLLQSAAAARSFRSHGRLVLDDIWPLTLPALLGAGAGAAAASLADHAVLEPVIITLLVTLGLLMALRPRLVIASPSEGPLRVADRPSMRLWLFATGLYGGFLQAGVGYFLLAVLGGGLRYDLARGNALKLVMVASFTVPALAIFVANGLVDWLAGGLLAVASAVGGLLAVRVAVRVDQRVLRWIVVAAITASCGAVLLR